jgi:hypothetical protein
MHKQDMCLRLVGNDVILYVFTNLLATILDNKLLFLISRCDRSQWMGAKYTEFSISSTHVCKSS